MKKIYMPAFVAALAVFFFASILNAQIKNSVYSMFGVGQLVEDSYGINKSLGGTGIAFQSGTFINGANPASYLGILPHSIVAEIGAYGILSKSASGKVTQRDGTINANYFSASLYVKSWWSTSVGIVPFSYIDYEINSSDPIAGETVLLNKMYKGTGGLSRVYLGNAFRIYKGLAVGFNTSYIGGPITQTETAAGNSSFSGYEIKNKRTASCLYVDYGLQYSMPWRRWMYTLGIVYGPSQELNTTDAVEFTYEGTTSSLIQDEGAALKIPQKIGIGVSVKKGNTFRAGFDYEWRDWAEIRFTTADMETRNSERLSAGLEFSPSQEKKWFEKLSYRLGANFKNSYLAINNKQINSFAITGGVGIAQNRASHVVLALEYGEVGTLSKKLIKNSYWSFNITYSLYDFWNRRSFGK
jgi:hypothetical protein